MTREEFFASLQGAAKWDVAVAIARTNPLPLDANSVFESFEALTTYAESNPLAYPGQIVSVLGETEIAAYLIKTVGAGALISKLAASSSTGDVAHDVEVLQTQVANIINGTQVVGKATADAAGNVIADTYATKEALTGVSDELGTVKTDVATNKTDIGKLKTDVATAQSAAEAAQSAADEAKTLAGQKVGTVSLTTGEANGTVKLTVDGTSNEVAVKGLGSAAYTESTAYDAAGKAQELVEAHNTSDTAHTDIRESITALAEKVSGRSTAYVFANKDAEDYKAAIAKAGSFVVGDTIYFTDNDIPDQWVVAVNDAAPFYTFQDIETEKVNLDGYVKDTRTINGKDLKTDIVLGVADIANAASKDEVATAKQEAITAAGEAADTKIATAKEEILGSVDTKLGNYVTTEALDAKKYITKDVADLMNYTTTDEMNTLLAGKQAHSDNLDNFDKLTGTGLVKKTADGYAVDTNAYITDAALADYAKSADVTQEIAEAVADKQTAAQVNALIAAATIQGSKVSGKVAEATLADKVANMLTVGTKEYNGSEAVEITAADLGALTAIPAATAEALGGIQLGYESTDTKRAVELDENNKAFVQIPAAMVYGVIENGGLEMDGNNFGIKEVSTDKLIQGTQELILNGGAAALR